MGSYRRYADASSKLTIGEWQLIRQLRDVMRKMDGKPYQVSVVVDGRGTFMKAAVIEDSSGEEIPGLQGCRR